MKTSLLPQGKFGALLGSVHVLFYITSCNNGYVSLQAADSDRSVGIWFATETENENKDLISVLWVRENGWKKSSFSPQPY